MSGGLTRRTTQLHPQEARNYEIHRSKIERMKPTVTSTLSTRTRSASLCCALPATLQIDNSPPMTSQLIHIKHNMKKN